MTFDLFSRELFNLSLRYKYEWDNRQMKLKCWWIEFWWPYDRCTHSSFHVDIHWLVCLASQVACAIIQSSGVESSQLVCIGWTSCGNFGLNSSLVMCNLVTLAGIVSHLLELSIVIVVVVARLPWLLCMSLKFIAWGISGCAYLWWNLHLCCPVGPFCSSYPYSYGWPKL